MLGTGIANKTEQKPIKLLNSWPSARNPAVCLRISGIIANHYLCNRIWFTPWQLRIWGQPTNISVNNFFDISLFLHPPSVVQLRWFGLESVKPSHLVLLSRLISRPYTLSIALIFYTCPNCGRICKRCCLSILIPASKL